VQTALFKQKIELTFLKLIFNNYLFTLFIIKFKIVIGQVWDFVILVAIMYVALIVPFNAAFNL
jgi:hypothetical protein